MSPYIHLWILVILYFSNLILNYFNFAILQWIIAEEPENKYNFHSQLYKIRKTSCCFFFPWLIRLNSLTTYQTHALWNDSLESWTARKSTRFHWWKKDVKTQSSRTRFIVTITKQLSNHQTIKKIHSRNIIFTISQQKTKWKKTTKKEWGHADFWSL